MDIINNDENVKVMDFSNNQLYSVYCGKHCVFMIDEDFNSRLGSFEYTLEVDGNKLKFIENSPDLKSLYKLCEKKYNEQRLQRENNTLNFLAKFTKREK